jgi:predicted nucleic acid-binding protein
MPSPAAGSPHILIDVDVVLDVLARREPFFADSAAVLAACETARCRGMVAAHTVTTLSHLLSKHHDESYAGTQIAELLRIVNVAAANEEVIRRALAAGLPDFEDAVQTAAAAAAGADYLVTRNLAHFSGGPVPAITPAEFLPLLGSGL